MSYSAKSIGEVIQEFLNRTTYLPAIQREYVWDTENIEKLFDSLLGDYPISSFLFWKIREEKKQLWTAYKFIQDFDEEKSHNQEANLAGIRQDIYLVLDGQQRLTSLFIGLTGSYRKFHYRWRKTRLYLNLFKKPERNENPEELMYQFAFREDDQPDSKDPNPQHWYLVSQILDFAFAGDARKDIRNCLRVDPTLDLMLEDNAVNLIERLHAKIFTERLINFYEERSDDYDKVVEVFIRANTGGKKLEYSDILLSTATAKWQTLNAREEIHHFTDSLNTIGGGYTFGKDFVLKGCLYLTTGLPIQYKVRNFTRPNLELIENNWETIKANLQMTIELVHQFGFHNKNLVSTNALLPIALYLKNLNKKNFVDSSNQQDVKNKQIIQKWLILALLKNAFGSSSDSTLKNLQDIINEQTDLTVFPFEAINKKLNIEPSFSETEIENLLKTPYSSKYSLIILSLLYPDRDWIDSTYHEDHIFPKSEFTTASLSKRGYNPLITAEYLEHFNTVVNLQLLKSSENLEKNAKAFDFWLPSRDRNFIQRHLIPQLEDFGFDHFLEFVQQRRDLIKVKLQSIAL
jgi:Protein of unknown function DUF262